MPAYLLALVTISDPGRFAAYRQAVSGLRKIYGGELVVRGAVQMVLEGRAAPGEEVSILRFPDAKSIRAYISSPRYREARRLRVGAAKVTFRLFGE